MVAEDVPQIVVSRTDRIGDLILALPVLGHLRRAGLSDITLHLADYTKDLGEIAVENGLCDHIWIKGQAAPGGLRQKSSALLLYYESTAVADLKAGGVKKILGPRNKLSSLWHISKSVPQHRSQVKKSEMEYNIDLADAMLKYMGLRVPEFEGLKKLRLPQEWKKSTQGMPAARSVLFLCNGGSAENWTVDEYWHWAQVLIKDGADMVDFVVSGNDSVDRMRQLIEFGVEKNAKMRVFADFARLRDLCLYIESANRVIASSSGPLHLAHALGKEVFGIYPKERVRSFKRWRPNGYWHDKLVSYIEL